MAEKILITSFKGGSGVTTCCVELGLALAASGERTLIVDGDYRTSCAMLTAGCAELSVYTAADYENGACRAKQTLVTHPQAINLCFMPTQGRRDPASVLRAVNDVEGLFDYVLMDKTAADICNRAIIVTEPSVPSVKSADCCRSELSDGGIKKIELIVNKINGGQVLNGETLSAKEISSALHTPLVAVIPEDLLLTVGKIKKSTARAFRLAASAVRGKSDEVCNVIKQYFGLNGYLKRKMREKI